MANEQQIGQKINFTKLTLLSICFASVCLFEGYQASDIKCGTKDITRPLVKNGYQTLRGEWPFIVALYQFRQPEPFCGGTLISVKHVLTAAHCFETKYTSNYLSSDALEVYIGAHNLTAKEGFVRRNVSEIYVHPEWNVYDDRYDADIAILVLSDNVVFTNFIRPVCIPTDDESIDGATIDTKGVIVGWGSTENETMEQIPRQTITKALNNSYCFRSKSDMDKISSARTFCGGDGRGVPNRGDSGGGFFVDSGSAWVQYGIISTSGTNATGYVTINSFAVYTNVKLFKHWIVETVSQSGVEMDEAIRTEKIDLKCHYNYSGLNLSRAYYTCFIDGMDIQSDNTEVASFTGSHRNGKTDQDIERFEVRSGTMFYIPSGIGRIFKNLKFFKLKFNSSALHTKSIRRSNFMNMEDVVNVGIDRNNIETIAEDSFWSLPQLEIFNFIDNEIKEIKEKTFEGNGKLKEVYLYSNKLEFIPGKLFHNNLLLEKVLIGNNFLETLDESVFANNSKLSMVNLDSNQLKFIAQNVFRNNVLLEKVILSVNSLRSIEETTFVNNVRLKEVHLRSNELEFLPANLFQSNSLLEIVDVSKNALKTIENTTFIKNLRLKEINLSSNKLQFIPENLFQGNFLLERLHLYSNSLKSIEETTFANNARLKEINLYSNKLAIIPSDLFQNNVFLDTIRLLENNLKTIDERTFINNTKLRRVYLGSNQLEYLPSNLFHKNSLLEVIFINYNALKSIDEATFMNNPKLREVYYDANHLEFLPENLFRNNLLLEEIDFRNNSLKIIDVDFTGLKNIQTIIILSNPCIDRFYKGFVDDNTYYGEIKNLTEFQNIIRANCSSVNL